MDFIFYSSMKSPVSLSFLQVTSPFCIDVPRFGFPAAAVRSRGRRCRAWVALGQCWQERGGLLACTFTPAISRGFLEPRLQRSVLGDLSVSVLKPDLSILCVLYLSLNLFHLSLGFFCFEGCPAAVAALRVLFVVFVCS